MPCARRRRCGASPRGPACPLLLSLPPLQSRRGQAEGTAPPGKLSRPRPLRSARRARRPGLYPAGGAGAAPAPLPPPFPGPGARARGLARYRPGPRPARAALISPGGPGGAHVTRGGHARAGGGARSPSRQSRPARRSRSGRYRLPAGGGGKPARAWEWAGSTGVSQCIIPGALEGVKPGGKEKLREKPENNIGCVGRELGALVESQGVALGGVGGEPGALRVATKR
ncbi:translation initiation factor IF-2-like [Vidua chalybeata]|uniref:translation initiation factor IF-2-like n=1 Tax=Vidua chalybeata TaxID=81927 RepID=UPI0023A7EB5D|nr:translation initiation factor IF-2-like [Vidua chalybeata]